MLRESHDCREADHAGVWGTWVLTSHSGFLRAWENWDPRPSMLAALHCLSLPGVGGTGGPMSGLVLQAPLQGENRWNLS